MNFNGLQLEGTIAPGLHFGAPRLGTELSNCTDSQISPGQNHPALGNLGDPLQHSNSYQNWNHSTPCLKQCTQSLLSLHFLGASLQHDDDEMVKELSKNDVATWRLESPALGQ